jgi:hypothetical protein
MSEQDKDIASASAIAARSLCRMPPVVDPPVNRAQLATDAFPGGKRG